MNNKSIALGVVPIIFVAIFTLIGCDQPTGNGNESDKDSMLIEVWDSSNPPKFMGYDTGMGQENHLPLILTSKGFCVQINTRQTQLGAKKHYGYVAYWDRGMSYEEMDEILNSTGWGCYIIFATTLNPTSNDKPYFVVAAYNRTITNQVFFNPSNDGTYYTWDGMTSQSITFPSNFKYYSPVGAIRTYGDDTNSEFEWMFDWLPGNTHNLIPLKKIGGYNELGLPNPDEITFPLINKVK